MIIPICVVSCLVSRASLSVVIEEVFAVCRYRSVSSAVRCRHGEHVVGFVVENLELTAVSDSSRLKMVEARHGAVRAESNKKNDMQKEAIQYDDES